ncbi:carboxymuconolactone decarboxylase family protein [Pseudonocardia sp. N23]|uniref:carboxymuconolactone decarboxylase family protein n=1 Tax=Pseudonocardia sp. N23 TaxID=1987376 RepID=UPI00209C3ECB|nr:carboxymuconolactone decarboxylase family protein [Pseudonocardia sp. N23]
MAHPHTARARMTHPVMTLPATMKALLALSASTEGHGVDHRTMELVHLRASKINGCSVCVDTHARDLRKGGESDERLFAVAAWRDAPWSDDAERAALAPTEAVTRIADSADPVPDDVRAGATRHYDEEALSALLVAIASVNVWNRLDVATRQPAGQLPG